MQVKYNTAENKISIENIMAVNHEPHPFVIGPRHVVDASNRSGVIDDETLENITCAHPGCNLLYADHSFETIILLKLLESIDEKAASDFINTITNDLLVHSIDGFAMIETEEKFRVFPVDGIKDAEVVEDDC